MFLYRGKEWRVEWLFQDSTDSRIPSRASFFAQTGAFQAGDRSMEDIKAIIAKNITDLRAAKGMTQLEQIGRASCRERV